MSNNETINFIEEWLKQRKIKKYFSSKKNGHKKYIKMQEEELYELCYKLVDLIKNNLIW